ncbi:uncharacterized protein LOC130676403 isoform X13 [Microplitis mediator]|uniref:uncharacterized protein LOC130676403 isoform X13 n=1 Tax=Microplitis mediator TaxID=375433 RepID=UPI0025575700|nr:uncharacterized protein LOC130676403 isoform X13 [Microplitis mediator]
MAELVENKTTSLVSKKQNDLVCGANSNIALINFDQITSSNQLLLSENNNDNDKEKGINGCIIVNNVDESSIKNIIDNELALMCLKNELEQENKKMLIDDGEKQVTNHHHQLELSTQLCQDLLGINNTEVIIPTDIEHSNDTSQNIVSTCEDNSGETNSQQNNIKLVDLSYQDCNRATAAACDARDDDHDDDDDDDRTNLEASGLNTLIDFQEDAGKKTDEKTRILAVETKNAEESLVGDSLNNFIINWDEKNSTQCYTLESTKCKELTKFNKETIETGVSIKQLKSSFNKFDALTKKSVLHTRSSIDTVKKIAGQNGGCDANPNCRSCGKVVFQMEQTKAEGLIWHKNCFRCIQCSKQLNVDNYESHECTLYCKPHFKELFQPKPVDDSNRSPCPQKPEMIIRENHPKELPPDVVRASDKPDLGLEELSSLNVKSRFQVFEKSSTNEQMNDIEKSASLISVKRSPSILSKLAKFQAKGMDIGVADESLNGIPYEESSESEEEEDNEEDEEGDADIVKSKKSIRERPISFTKMDDMKNRWEVTSQQGRRESQREARKEEIAGIRSRLFMGKQGKMKELYQQAVATSERVTKINPADEIQCTTAHARSIKEKFERGEPITCSNEDEADSNSTSNKIKQEKPDEDVIAAGISRKSRSLFLELDASAAKSGRPMTPAAAVANSKSLTDTSRRARDVRADDVVRSTDTTEEIHVETSDISNKFKFFETYKEPEKERKQFRITPPRDGQVKVNSPEREIYRDPDVIRAEDKVDQVVHTDTTKKMLSIFRQMEEKATKEDVPDGPKPLKRFTPPPEDKYAKLTASDTDEEEDGEEEEDDGNDDITEEERRNPNYVRASDKMEDEFLKNAQNAANAKTLRAKFEQWEVNDKKINNHNTIVDEMELIKATNGDGEQASIESTRSLKARFESLGTPQVTESPRAPKVKVNRFVGIPTTIDVDVCESCQKKVYPLEKIETNNKMFHKQCFRCLQCNCILRMDSFTLNNGKLYCIPHFKQLFIVRGNYEEGFGIDQHKNKWISNGTLDISSQNPTSSPMIIDS